MDFFQAYAEMRRDLTRPSPLYCLSLWLYLAYASASGKYPKESNIDGGDLESDRAGILEGMHAIVILSPQSAGIAPGDAITLRS